MSADRAARRERIHAAFAACALEVKQADDATLRLIVKDSTALCKTANEELAARVHLRSSRTPKE